MSLPRVVAEVCSVVRPHLLGGVLHFAAVAVNLPGGREELMSARARTTRPAREWRLKVLFIRPTTLTPHAQLSNIVRAWAARLRP